MEGERRYTEYFKLFEGKKASGKQIERECPSMMIAVGYLVREGSVVGQRELPLPAGTGDIIYEWAAKRHEAQEYLEAISG